MSGAAGGSGKSNRTTVKYVFMTPKEKEAAKYKYDLARCLPSTRKLLKEGDKLLKSAQKGIDARKRDQQSANLAARDALLRMSSSSDTD